MFGIGRRRKQEEAKRELVELGNQAVSVVNSALEQWRATSLELRRSMLDESFAERIVNIDASNELSFETCAEIEALALMKNWLEGTDSYKAEFVQLLDPGTLDCVAALDLGAPIDEHLVRHITEVSAELEDDLDRAITEAVERRREITTRTGNRALLDRCQRNEPFVDSLTFYETLHYMKAVLGPDAPANRVTGIMRRLYDLALVDHHISDEERNIALTLAGALEADVEVGLQGNPEGLKSFREAVTYHKESARRCGFGSLQWKIEERGIPAADIIEFIAREEHSALLPAFLEMLGPDVIRKTRTEILNAMVAARPAR